ncbi:vesicular, overexpressed in cancer, prosurvival protein 1 [Nematostella vectensis]|uniref:vesicular, overexpressed in cancer, prosurvival protein 1 n=1 Tax=Nematostella vectensis TaxID=45351 RepID=UPI00207793DA|nr:vesicular, overexpressed in cancer, prosurvival protein 1 [Nematostella vectensis]
MSKWSALAIAIAQFLSACQAYTYCTYTYYDANYSLRRSSYTCANNEYCCGTRSCCTVVYARWYLWFVLSSFFLVIFIIWWYYRYRYAPRRRLLLTTAPASITTTVTHPYPGGPYPGPPAGWQPPPAYSAHPGGPIMMAPAQGMVHYNTRFEYSQGPPPPYAHATGMPNIANK